MAQLPDGWKADPKEYGRKVGGKDHDADVARGEGVPMGKKHTGGAHDKVVDAKPRGGAAAAAQKEHERRENGGADPTGCCGKM